MGTEDNLFYELKALHSISKEAKILYNQLTIYEDEAKGKDVLIICENRVQLTDWLKIISKKYVVDWVKCRIKVGTDTIYFKTLDEVKNDGLIGSNFRRIIFN